MEDRLDSALAGHSANEDALTESILRLTVGAACASAEDRLLDYVDGILSPMDRRLVEGHLRSCEGCEALAGELARLRDELPGLARLDPDAGFSAEVAARTSRAPRPTRWPDRIRAWAEGCWSRPRFALEAAYIGGLLAVSLLSALPAANPLQASSALWAGVRSETLLRLPAKQIEAWRADARALAVEGLSEAREQWSSLRQSAEGTASRQFDSGLRLWTEAVEKAGQVKDKAELFLEENWKGEETEPSDSRLR